MLGEKCRGQLLVATSAAGRQMGRLLYFTECELPCQYQFYGRMENRHDTLGLLVANNSPIVTYGTRSLRLNLGLRHKCTF